MRPPNLREDVVVKRECDGLLVRLGSLEHVARGARERPLLEQIRAGEQTLVLVVEEDDVHALVADVIVHHREYLRRARKSANVQVHYYVRVCTAYWSSSRSTPGDT